MTEDLTDNSWARYPSLEGRSIFITGAANGIGARMVERFVAQGCDVAFVDLDGDAAARLNATLEQAFGKTAWFRQLDVSDADDLERSIADAGEHQGTIDVLINNAANDTRHEVETFAADDWRDCMAVNLDAAYIACRAVLPFMKRRGRGSIINIGSINAYLGTPNMPGYVTAKAGLIGLTKALAREFGVCDIRVNALLPGWIATPKQLRTWLTTEAEAKWIEQAAIKKRLTSDDVCALALFLASDDSARITGQEFVVDAGRT